MVACLLLLQHNTLMFSSEANDDSRSSQSFTLSAFPQDAYRHIATTFISNQIHLRLTLIIHAASPIILLLDIQTNWLMVSSVR